MRIDRDDWDVSALIAVDLHPLSKLWSQAQINESHSLLG